MKIILLESKRILSRIILVAFLAFVFVVSVYDSHKNLDVYNVRNVQGIEVGWKDNLSNAKSASRGLYLDKKCMEKLKENSMAYGYLNGRNIREFIFNTYERKPLAELTEEEMGQFLQKRAETIYETLVLDTQKGYTEEEISRFMDRAESLSALSMEYAEGWKVLAEKMGSFVFLIVIMISALTLPLFGRDPAVRMEELIRSSRYGKRPLDQARIAAAYLTATVLYFCSMAVYLAAVMLPFGFDGAGRQIQSNIRTFYSLCDITYLQQFLLNLLIGYVVLNFMISLVLAVTVVIKNMLAAASFIAMFTVMLIICSQINLYQVNHWFANFMPVRMTDYWHFYTGNELYRIFGRSISCLSWSVIVSLILSAIFFMVGIVVLILNRKRGLS